MPSWSSPIPTSSSARIIPLERTPRSFASPSFDPSGMIAPGSATATVCPASTFGAPHTIVCGSLAAHVDLAHAEAVRVRVPLRGQDPADHELRRVAHARPVEPLELVARHREGVGDLLGARAGVAVRAQPRERDPHEPNCSSTRRSLSNSVRRSGTS